MAAAWFGAIWQERRTRLRGRVVIDDEFLVLDAGGTIYAFDLRFIVAVDRAAQLDRLDGLPTLVLRLVDGRAIPIAPCGFGVASLLAEAIAAARCVGAQPAPVAA